MRYNLLSNVTSKKPIGSILCGLCIGISLITSMPLWAQEPPLPTPASDLAKQEETVQQLFMPFVLRPFSVKSAKTLDPTQTPYENGYTEGHTDGYAIGSEEGYQVGYPLGFADGEGDLATEDDKQNPLPKQAIDDLNQIEDGEDDYGAGYIAGYQDGYDQGYQDGYDHGYADGRNDATTDQADLEQDDSTALEPWLPDAFDPNARNLNELQIGPEVAGTTAIYTIAKSEDFKGNGFPDSRKLVRNSLGHLFFVTRNKVNENEYHIRLYRSLDDGKSWQVINQGSSIDNPQLACNQRVPSIAIDNFNVLHIGWYGRLDKGSCPNPARNDRQVLYARANVNGNSITLIRDEVMGMVTGYATNSNLDYWQEHPVITIGPDRTVYVVWEGRDTDKPDKGRVFWRRSNDGGFNWQAGRIPVASEDDDLSGSTFSRPTLLVNPLNRNQIFVFAYAGQQIRWTQSTDKGNTWRKWKSVSPDQLDQRHVSAAIDKQGRIHLVWRQKPEQSGSGKGTRIHYSMYSNGKWSKPLIFPSQKKYQFFPSITVANPNDGNNQANLWAAWGETNDESNYPREEPTTGCVYAMEFRNGEWQTPLQQSCNGAVYPSLRSGYWPLSASSVDLVWIETENKDSCGSGCPIKYTRLK